MKALVYSGPRNVRIEDVPDPTIERPTDALVRITSTNICGSDLHMYEGRTSVEKGKVLGHENLGEVIEIGDAVVRVKIGDRVCLPFNIACGFCRNCEKGQTGFCLTTNPGSAGAAYGYADMGPYDGGQAEYLRVPFADFNCLRLPEDAVEKEDDYVMLSDIFPTGWHATRLANLRPGESIVIYGAGPVGLMAAYSAVLQGAKQVMVVDRHPDRLRLAEKIGAIHDDQRAQPEAQRDHLALPSTERDLGCVYWRKKWNGMSTSVLPPDAGNVHMRTEFSMHLAIAGSLPVALVSFTVPLPEIVRWTFTFTSAMVLPPRSQH